MRHLRGIDDGRQQLPRLLAEAVEPALLLLFANIDPGDVCYYPDSNKLVVDVTDTLVRCEPQLDYYDGEA